MQIDRLSEKIFRKEAQQKAYMMGQINSIHGFYRVLERERNRADRSGLPFALISFKVKGSKLNGKFTKQITKAIFSRMRTTDEAGWIDHQHIGLLLYNSGKKAAQGFFCDIEKSISPKLPKPNWSYYIYPPENDDSEEADAVCNDPIDETKYRFQDDTNGASSHLTSFASDYNMIPAGEIKTIFTRKMPVWKRALDIFGALFGLIISSPLFLLISLLIKIVSPGPIFFIQERIGYGGRLFKFLKFRTMKVGADSSVHQEYYASLIKEEENGDKPMTKLDGRDPKIIPFGNIIRNACIDELPQLINVLRGEMSLVGPRPPIPYEVEEYLRWHNWRFDVVPGMTGLWQVSGKNRLTFKEMIRLDIKYSRNLSLLSDIKILMMTPVAIISELLSKLLRAKYVEKGDESHG